jgi:hypothetical protein
MQSIIAEKAAQMEFYNLPTKERLEQLEVFLMK